MSIGTSKIPSVPTMIGNLLHSASSLLSCAIATGNVFANDDLVTTRLLICKSCEFFIPEQTRCGKCGCFMDNKVKLLNVKCPVNKW